MRKPALRTTYSGVAVQNPVSQSSVTWSNTRFHHALQPDDPPLTSIRIYVDADACPVKDEIYRVAERHGVRVSVVAGNFIRVPNHPMIERIAAGPGMDAADDWIAERAGKSDIVITAD